MLTVGLVGCGRIGARTPETFVERHGPNWLPISHADAIAKVDGLRLVACCDIDAEAARFAADRFPGARPFSSADSMLDHVTPDVLCIATRGDVRPAVLRLAAERGVRAVHCEKPLAHSVAAADAACNSIRTAGMAFSYGAVRRYMSIFRKALELAWSGEIGPVLCVSVRFGRTGLLWNHPHSVDLLTRLSRCDEVVSVQGTLALTNGVELNEGVMDCDPLVLGAVIVFANGVTGHIVDEPGLNVTIAGTTGAVDVVDDGGGLILRRHSTGVGSAPTHAWRIEADSSEVSGRVVALTELRDALLSGVATSLSIDDALQQQRILFAIAQSHIEGGRRVRLDEVDSDLVITGRTGGRVA